MTALRDFGVNQMQPSFEDVLKARGLTVEDGLALGLTLSTAHTEWPEGDRFLLHGQPCLMIPYHDFRGEALKFAARKPNSTYTTGTPAPFYQARHLGIGWLMPDGSHAKYLTCRGAGAPVYVPYDRRKPNFWPNLIADPLQPLCITEGAFKAIACTNAGLPSLGLFGVSCIAKDGKLNPLLTEVVWAGRRVYVCFDVDQSTQNWVYSKDQPYKTSGTHGSVQAALDKTVDYLQGLGAEVRIIRLDLTAYGASHAGEEKLALDDMLLAGHTTIHELTSDAVALKPPRLSLNDMLEDYALIPGNVASVVELKTGDLYSRPTFMDLMRPYTTTGRDGKVLRLVELWLNSSHKKVIRKLINSPLRPSGYLGDGIFNISRGYGCEPLEPPENCQAIADFEKFGDRMWEGNWPWVRGMVAHWLQKPDELRTHALLLSSPDTGIGKTAFFELLSALVDKPNEGYAAIDLVPNIKGNKDLTPSLDSDRAFSSRFNDVLSGVKLVLLDEFSALNATRAAKLTAMITSPTIVIERKGYATVTEPRNFITCITTNSLTSLNLDSGNGRRFCVGVPRVSPMEREAWQTWLRGFLARVHDASLPDASYILAYLLDPKWLADYNPTADAPWGGAKEQVQEDSRSRSELIAMNLYDYLPEVFSFDKEFYSEHKYLCDKVSKFAMVSDGTVQRINGRNTRVRVLWKGQRYEGIPEEGVHEDDWTYELRPVPGIEEYAAITKRNPPGTLIRKLGDRAFVKRVVAETMTAVKQYIAAGGTLECRD